MATLRTKTVRYFWDTRTADLATNTTLGTATRYDATAITLTLPEASSRSFLSVVLRMTFRDRFTVANEITGVRMGIKLGAAAAADTDRAFTQANTGDHAFEDWTLDVTDYFTANFGSGTTQTAVGSLAVATTAASNIGGNITAELIITYQYDDDVGTTRVKSIPIPIGSHSTTLTTAQQEIGVDGVNPPPSAQIPALSSYLEEASVAIKQAAIVITANDAAGTAVDLNPEIQIDATAAVARGVVGQALQTLMPYRDVFIYDTATFSTGSTHTLKMRDTTTTGRFALTGAVMWVTYTYDKSASTRVLNYVQIPLTLTEADIEGLTAGTSFSSNIAGDAQAFTGIVDVTEPGTITLKQSAAIAVITVNSSSAGMQVSAGAQSYRLYSPATSSGENPIVHRGDYGSGWSLARGRNTLLLRIYGSSTNRSTMVGAYAIVVWSSDVPILGTEACTRVATFFNSTYGTTPAALIDVAASGGGQRDIVLGSPWRMTALMLEGRIRSSNSATQTFLERRSGELEAAGFSTSDLRRANGIAELSCWWWYDGFTKSFNGDHLHTGKLAPQTTRRQAIYNVNVAVLAHWWTSVTFHQHAFTVAGTLTVDGSGASGKTVKVWAIDASNQAELVTTAVTDGSGAFSTSVPDNTRTYWVSYADGATAKYGRSLDGVAGTDTFNITIGGTVSISFPSLSISTTADSIRDRISAVIEALVPAIASHDAFIAYRNDLGADFEKWAEANPQGAIRRFQVRDTGDDQPPATSNTDNEERLVTFRVVVAYPQSHHWGAQNALDRDDAMSKDQHQIEHAIGMCGRQNFSPPNPDACWRSGSTTREVGDACDFLVIEQTMSFRRSMT